MGAAAVTLVPIGLSPHAQAGPKPSPPPKFKSIVSFCEARGTVDFPPDKGFGPPDDNGIPPEVRAIDATKWRCLNKHVLVCADSADGDQCAKKADDRMPKIVVEVCRDDPELAFVPTYAGHPYRYDWKCHAGKPLITKSYPLDGGGFFAKAWAPLVVKDGRVVAPKAAPDIVR